MTDDVERALGTGAKCDDPECDLCVAQRAAAEKYDMVLGDDSPVTPTSEPDAVNTPPVFNEPAAVFDEYTADEVDAV